MKDCLIFSTASNVVVSASRWMLVPSIVSSRIFNGTPWRHMFHEFCQAGQNVIARTVDDRETFFQLRHSITRLVQFITRVLRRDQTCAHIASGVRA